MPLRLLRTFALAWVLLVLSLPSTQKRRRNESGLRRSMRRSNQGHWRLVQRPSLWVLMMSNTDTDDELLAALRARVAHPSTRVDTHVMPVVSVYPPATEDMLASTESNLGFALNTFLKRIYLEVANGGFGPGYGLLGRRDLVVR
jgi:hypothetical protein